MREMDKDAFHSEPKEAATHKTVPAPCMKKSAVPVQSAQERELERSYDEKTESYAREQFALKMQRERMEDKAQRREDLWQLIHAHGSGPGRNVLLRITGRQWSLGELTEEITVTTQGRYYKKNGRHYLLYKESAESGMGQTSTTVMYNQDGSVTLKRSGEQQMTMVFMKGKKHISNYRTPYGLLRFSFYTNYAEFSSKRNGGIFKLSYNIDAGNESSVATKLDIDFSFLK